MKALSIKQPWARMICLGLKDIENRDWSIKFRGRIYVHSGLKSERHIVWPNMEHLAIKAGVINTLKWEEFANWWADDYYDNDPEESGSGAIIGEVDITNCVDKSDSPWFVGKYGLVLANPVLYDKPIPYRGQLGFFEVKLPTPILDESGFGSGMGIIK